MIKTKLSKIYLTPGACQLRDRITVSCPVDETPREARELLNKGEEISLADLLAYFPISTINLFTCAEEKNKTILDIADILEVFGGKLHLADCQEKLENPNMLIPTSKKPFLKRMQEIGLDLSLTKNKATFALLDILTIGKVIGINGEGAQVKVGKIKLINVAIPPLMEIRASQKVALHYGAIVFVLDNQLAEIMEKIQTTQQKNPFFARVLKNLEGITIDCSNVCPAPGRRGTNLTKWFLDRI